MDNWKDYVPVQPFPSKLTYDDPTRPIRMFFLQYLPPASPNMTGRVHVFRKEFYIHELIDESEVGDKVEELFLSFPKKYVAGSEDKIIAARQGVSTTSGRGFARTNWENTWFYKGITVVDAPIIAAGSDALGYYIFKHPDFDKYGFNIA